MKTLIDRQFIQDVKNYRLKFCCEDCAYYRLETQSCAEGYPNSMHRLSSLDGKSLIFCKLFELGS